MTTPHTPPRIELPDTGDGSRRRRRQAPEPRAPRRPLATSKALAIGAVVTLAALVTWVALGFLGDGDGEPTPASVPAGTFDPDAPGPSLVVMTGQAGEVYGVAILVASSGAIVHVPPGTMLEVPSLGLTSLRDAAKGGGVELLRHSLENVLGVQFTAVASLDPAGLGAAVEPVGALTVVIDEAVEERSSTGRITELVPAGRQTLAPSDIAGVLAPVGDASSLDRIVRHQAFWNAYLEALGDAEPAPAWGAEVGSSIGALGDADVTHQVLPVESVAGVGGDDELFRVRAEALATLVERFFPGAAPPAERIRVRILNGAGAPGVAQLVQPLLVEVGGEVTLSGNADRFDYGTTQIVYYDDDRLAAARAIHDALGLGEVVKSVTPLDVVDVTIVVGTDFLAAHGG